MNFSDGAVGQLTSSWMSGPETERIVYHGVEGTLDVGRTTFAFTMPWVSYKRRWIIRFPMTG